MFFSFLRLLCFLCSASPTGGISPSRWRHPLSQDPKESSFDRPCSTSEPVSRPFGRFERVDRSRTRAELLVCPAHIEEELERKTRGSMHTSVEDFGHQPH